MYKASLGHEDAVLITVKVNKKIPFGLLVTDAGAPTVSTDCLPSLLNLAFLTMNLSILGRKSQYLFH